MEKISKIGITSVANEALDKMVAMANDGFTGGEVTKNDLASWILVQFEQRSFQSQIERIRKDHFDNVQYLITTVEKLKKARQEGEKEISLEEVLAPLMSQINSTSVQGKRRSKQLEIESNSDQGDLESQRAKVDLNAA